MDKLTVITIALTVYLSPYPATVLYRADAQNSGAAQEPIQAGHTNGVIEVKWSPDDERLISYSAGDDHIRLWEVKSARLLWSARTTFIQQKDEYFSLTNFAWSPDQRLIASGSGNVGAPFISPTLTRRRAKKGDWKITVPLDASISVFRAASLTP